jgi:hypothetical protein
VFGRWIAEKDSQFNQIYVKVRRGFAIPRNPRRTQSIGKPMKQRSVYRCSRSRPKLVRKPRRLSPTGRTPHTFVTPYEAGRLTRHKSSSHEGRPPGLLNPVEAEVQEGIHLPSVTAHDDTTIGIITCPLRVDSRVVKAMISSACAQVRSIEYQPRRASRPARQTFTTLAREAWVGDQAKRPFSKRQCRRWGRSVGEVQIGAVHSPATAKPIMNMLAVWLVPNGHRK